MVYWSRGAAFLALAGLVGGACGTESSESADAGAGGEDARKPGENAEGGASGGDSGGGEQAGDTSVHRNPEPAGGAASGGVAGDECATSIGPQMTNGSSPLWSYMAFFCDLQRLCCHESCFAAISFESCEDDFLGQDSTVELMEFIDSGSVLLDEEALDDCAQALRARATSCVRTFAAMTNNIEDSGIQACEDAIQGTVPEGQACHHREECIHTSDPVICRRSSEDAPMGVCHLVRKGGLGDVCFRTEGSWFDPARGGSRWEQDIYNIPAGAKRCMLGEGLYCDEGGHCAELRGAGSPCDHLECADGLYCDGENCVPLTPTGAACTAESRCAGGVCLEGKCSTVVFSQTACEGT